MDYIYGVFPTTLDPESSKIFTTMEQQQPFLEMIHTPSSFSFLFLISSSWQNISCCVSRCSDGRDGISRADRHSRDFLRLRGGRAKLRDVVVFRRRFSFARWPQEWGADSHWSSGGGVEVAPLWSRHCGLQRLQTDETRRIIRCILSKWKYICALHVVVKHHERHLWSRDGGGGGSHCHRALWCNKELWFFSFFLWSSKAAWNKAVCEKFQLSEFNWLIFKSNSALFSFFSALLISKGKAINTMTEDNSRLMSKILDSKY